MKFKIIITIFTMMLLINCTFVCAVNINKKVNEKQSISKSSIEIDYAPIEKLSLKYFKLVYEKIGTPDCKLCISTDDDFNKTLGYSSGTSTIFEPPYSNCFSWGDGTFGIDEYSHGCNKYSGAIGAYANAWIGGATAEAMQRLDFYVGRQKTIDITAKIVRTGGKTTFGFGGFAGTEKTWSWDEFQNNYHRSDVDPWWTWELIFLKIISIVTLLTGYSPNGIGEAISLLSSIFDFEALENELDEMLDDGDAEILYITFSFSANPGYHKIWVGLRGTASACVTGMGAAVTMGQVEKITIDGIAAPESPSINGPSFCNVDTSYEFSGQSYDPNGDKILF